MVTSTEPPPDLPPDRPDYVAGVDERPQRRREWSGGIRSVVVPLLAVTAIVAAVWYFQRDPASESAGEAGIGIVALPADKNTTGRPPAVEIGRLAPDFQLRLLDGGVTRLSELRGGPVLLNFWASWCRPCREEMPEIVKQHQTRQGDGLRVLAVDLQEAEGPVRDFATQFGMTFPIAFDRTGAVARAYGVRELPATIFIDGNGVIRTIKYGPMTGDYLREQLDPLLPARAPAN